MVYSIGQAKRSDPALKTIAPAPNAYLPKLISKLQAPQWTIGGAAQRAGRSTSIGPGPGQYGYQSKLIEGPKYTISGKHETKQASMSPGPGNYNDESFSSVYKKQPMYTLGLKHHTSQKDLIPGPGQYDLNSSYISSNSIKFPTQPRLTSLEGGMSPGPGCNLEYNSQNTILTKQQSYYQRNLNLPGSPDMRKQDLQPGPGAYHLKSLLNLSKNFTIKQKLQNKDYSSYQPGPGAYDQDVSTIKSHYPSYKIGSELRNTQNAMDKLVPGPGQYYRELDSLNSLQKSAPSFKMPQALRKDLNDSVTITPGPGQYSMPKNQNTQMVSMKGSKYNPNNSSFIPGPGQYNPDDSVCKHKDGSVRIVPEHKSKQLLTQYFPGPGQYSVKSSLEGPQWGFSKDIRQGLIKKDVIPGPGAYNIPPKFNDVPKYLLPKQF
ncbi:unnamed protein product (macronuclear) [Paramecium tetraurelia]|uniref:Uncharacterized protein n=1 Tax=Paramecium tetraurelia TaxID=5888 RepID=A0C314_PARTE|nr:uncharacterized protein GSPATT00034659001 [Paramecium tetraurelia]CAK65181.1 unnamed protein product [Paramecium tetraurelia]|eukprot:XP_001432578.1 hypothetical protein (macronuclear) [Paramecium tetraurelia strain d4-2]